MENNTLSRKTFTLADKELELWVFIDSENNPWFKAKEIATFLEYKDTKQAIRDCIKDYNKKTWENMVGCSTPHLETPSNWQPKSIFINEPGLYQLILRSNKPQAECFERWVTSEVLPSIRKTGAYVAENINQSQLSQLMHLLSVKEENMKEKDLMIKHLVTSNNELVKSTTDLAAKVLEQKPRLAVMPSGSNKAHVLRIYYNTQNNHERHYHYKFVRPQKRNLPNINKHSWLKIYERNLVPNAMNVLNIYKTHLIENNIKYIVPNPNEIIVELVETSSLLRFINNLLDN